MNSEWQLAVAVPRWAWRFYRRHLVLVVGLSLVGSVQRLIVVDWTDAIPHSIALASEALVMAARIVLIVAIWRLAMPKGRPSWSHTRAFVKEHWLSLVFQVGLIMAAALVFKFGLDAVGVLLPESAQQTYLAVLLFVKNPTIIAFTSVWMVGVVRQVVLAREHAVVGEQH